ncbi:hypothetical protein JKG47_20205 [Acidithiobacillus sp. MC6.1]|nr:hypothetical protein [Acidithiobacillus sp. MC6.1]
MAVDIRDWTVKWLIASVLGMSIAAAGVAAANAQDVHHKKLTASSPSVLASDCSPFSPMVF